MEIQIVKYFTKSQPSIVISYDCLVYGCAGVISERTGIGAIVDLYRRWARTMVMTVVRKVVMVMVWEAVMVMRRVVVTVVRGIIMVVRGIVILVIQVVGIVFGTTLRRIGAMTFARLF
jgi:hypothetical protein